MYRILSRHMPPADPTAGRKECGVMLRAGLRRAIRVTTISLLGALCLGGAASAAGDRSDRAADPMPPRIVAQSNQFELVGVAHGKTLTIYLDRFIDNEPVVGATVNVEAAGQTVPADARPNGIYKLKADWVEQVGQHPVAFAIASDQGNERLAGTLEIPAASPASVPEASAEGPLARVLSFGNLFVFLLGALATLALRHGNRLSGLAVSGGNRLAAAFGAWHAGVAARIRRTAR